MQFGSSVPVAVAQACNCSSHLISGAGAVVKTKKEKKKIKGHNLCPQARALEQRQQCDESLDDPEEALKGESEADHAGATWATFCLYLWIILPQVTFWRLSVLTDDENWTTYTFRTNLRLLTNS